MGSENSKISTKNLHKTESKSTFSLQTFIKASSQTPESQFKKISKLGKGSFGSVFKCQSKKTQKLYALKCIKKEFLSESMSDKALKIKEAAILSKLDHPNIVKCFEIYENKKYLIISEELSENGTLRDFMNIQKVTPKIVALIAKQLLSAVAYVHEQGIVHRDIKLENVFLTRDLIIKLGDFGCAEEINQKNFLEGLSGTIVYMAPEIFNGRYNEKVDIWSIGIILYIMVTGKFPVNGKTKDEIIESISQVPEVCLETTKIQKFSKGFSDFIQGFFEINPKNRYSAIQALSHPWLKRMNIIDKNIHSDITTKLRNLKFRSTFQKIMTIYINTFYIQNDSLELFKFFSAIDQDGNGLIEKDELEEELRINYSEYEAKALADEFFGSYDMNSNGVIDYSEFVTALSSQDLVLNDQNVEKVFKLLDKNHQGFISIKDIEDLIGMSRSLLFPEDSCYWNPNLKIDIKTFKNLLL